MGIPFNNLDVTTISKRIDAKTRAFVDDNFLLYSTTPQSKPVTVGAYANFVVIRIGL